MLRRFENEFSTESKARMRNGGKNRRAIREREAKRGNVEENAHGRKNQENDEGRDFNGRSLEGGKAAAKGSKARSRIAFLKITSAGKLTAGQLPGRKSLGSSSPHDRSSSP